MPLHTHYDNLKVTRNAPPEVIRAAYRVLAQRHHPDINPSPDAARAMKIINEAYAVLCDPKRRAEHDAWIEEQLIEESIQEARAGVGTECTNRNQATPTSVGQPATPSGSRQPSTLVRFNNWMGTPAGTKFGLASLIGGALVAWHWLTTPPSAPIKASPSEIAVAAPTTVQASTIPDKEVAPDEARQKPINDVDSRENPAGTRRSIAPELPAAASQWSPNGKPWPNRAAYIEGFQRRATSGLTTLKIDNTNGGADVHVKLCRSSSGKCDGLRHVFIPSGASFTMRDISPGTYDIRYRALDNGALSKSQPIQLKQIQEEDGIRYSNVTLTLYRIQGGNTTFEGLTEGNF